MTSKLTGVDVGIKIEMHRSRPIKLWTSNDEDNDRANCRPMTIILAAQNQQMVRTKVPINNYVWMIRDVIYARESDDQVKMRLYLIAHVQPSTNKHK